MPPGSWRRYFLPFLPTFYSKPSPELLHWHEESPSVLTRGRPRDERRNYFSTPLSLLLFPLLSHQENQETNRDLTCKPLFVSVSSYFLSSHITNGGRVGGYASLFLPSHTLPFLLLTFLILPPPSSHIGLTGEWYRQ